jgi:hypothetical protein
MMCLLGCDLSSGITDRGTIQIEVSAFRLFGFVGTKATTLAASRGPGSQRAWFEADFVVDRVSESLLVSAGLKQQHFRRF